MDLQVPLEHRARVEEFQRKHRIGLLALLFTDLVGSTKLKQELGDRGAVALIQAHHFLVRDILGRFKEAEEIGTAGDSFFIVFAKPSDAVQFALMLQAKLRAMARETARLLSDRIGIHLGEVVIEERREAVRQKDLYGLQVDICARVMSLAEGNQILMTRSVFDNARQVLKGDDSGGVEMLSWLNHGPYVLKGVEEPLEICEVGESKEAVLKPPPDSEKVHRYVSPDSEPVLGWRPARGLVVPGTPWILEETLGEGGFGEVWLGQHQTLKDRRVFKFCFRTDRVRPLKREVTLFRLLKERVGEHPNIARVHDVCLEEPPFYLVTDYVEGRDLRSWCAAHGGIGKIPFATRLEIVAQVADGLQAAHHAGVIHRDIKPSNILIASRGLGPKEVQAKLTDFGIGQVVSQAALDGLTRLGFTQTVISSKSPTQSGTQLFMAPELLAGKPSSPRSDIYSLGVVLFQMLAGDFARPVTTDWHRVIADPLLREDLERCFAGNPEERFASVGELSARVRTIEQRRAALRQQREAAAAKQRAAHRRVKAGMICLAASVSFLVALLTYFLYPVGGDYADVRIETQPSGAEVWTGNKKLGTTPFRDRRANPGKVQYKLKLAGYREGQIVQAVQGEKYNFQVTLVRLDPSVSTLEGLIEQATKVLAIANRKSTPDALSDNAGGPPAGSKPGPATHEALSRAIVREHERPQLPTKPPSPTVAVRGAATQVTNPVSPTRELDPTGKSKRLSILSPEQGPTNVSPPTVKRETPEAGLEPGPQLTNHAPVVGSTISTSHPPSDLVGGTTASKPELEPISVRDGRLGQPSRTARSRTIKPPEKTSQGTSKAERVGKPPEVGGGGRPPPPLRFKPAPKPEVSPPATTGSARDAPPTVNPELARPTDQIRTIDQTPTRQPLQEVASQTTASHPSLPLREDSPSASNRPPAPELLSTAPDNQTIPPVLTNPKERRTDVPPSTNVPSETTPVGMETDPIRPQALVKFFKTGKSGRTETGGVESAPASQKRSPGGYLAEFEGKVEFYDSASGTWKPVKIKQEFSAGDMLRTGKRSRAILILSGQEVTVQESTTFGVGSIHR